MFLQPCCFGGVLLLTSAVTLQTLLLGSQADSSFSSDCSTLSDHGEGFRLLHFHSRAAAS